MYEIMENQKDAPTCIRDPFHDRARLLKRARGPGGPTVVEARNETEAPKMANGSGEVEGVLHICS